MALFFADFLGDVLLRVALGAALHWDPGPHQCHQAAGGNAATRGSGLGGPGARLGGSGAPGCCVGCYLISNIAEICSGSAD
jgi:hypothetical protein